jgi:DEAD/DEAH box helicase domain-containing protein
MSKKLNKVVFDLETKNLFQEVGSSDPAALSMSIACIYESATDTYSSFLEEDLPKLWPILERADMLVGYNSDHFDIPLLNKYYNGDLNSIKSLDLLVEIRKSLGRRVSLDQVAEGTLGRKKTGHGLQAIQWWKQGDIESIRKYCLEDVRITKDIYDYALENKMLKFKEAGKTFDIPLDIKNWEKKEEKAMTFSLPF